MKHLYLSVLLLCLPNIHARSPIESAQSSETHKKKKHEETVHATWTSLGKSLKKSKTALEEAMTAHATKDHQNILKSAEQAFQQAQESLNLAKEYASQAKE